jgi:hypothetical protein
LPICDRTENIIVEELAEKNMTGFSPDMKILITKIMTDENIENTKDYFIKQFQALDI